MDVYMDDGNQYFAGDIRFRICRETTHNNHFHTRCLFNTDFACVCITCTARNAAACGKKNGLVWNEMIKILVIFSVHLSLHHDQCIELPACQQLAQRVH